MFPNVQVALPRESKDMMTTTTRYARKWHSEVREARYVLAGFNHRRPTFHHHLTPRVGSRFHVSCPKECGLPSLQTRPMVCTKRLFEQLCNGPSLSYRRVLLYLAPLDVARTPLSPFQRTNRHRALRLGRREESTPCRRYKYYSLLGPE